MGTPIPNLSTERETASSGEVTTYQLAPEEVAEKYGAPKPRERTEWDIDKVMLAVNDSSSWEEAATKAKISIQALKERLGRYGLKAPWELDIEGAEASDELKNIPTGPGRLIALREALSKEKYLARKKEGLSDLKILQSMGIGNSGWTPILIALKKEWGLSGVGFVQKKEPVSPSTDIFWAVPRNKNTDPVVSLTNIRLHLSVPAVKKIKSQYVRVGGIDGKLILQPTQESDEFKYSLGQKGTRSMAIGGTSLVDQLISNGVAPGRYKMTYDMKNMWWEGTRID